MGKKFLGINLKRKAFFFRFLRFFVSVVMLSALILGITILVKEASNLDTGKISDLSNSTSQVIAGRNAQEDQKNLTLFLTSLFGGVKLPDLDPRPFFSNLFKKAATKVIYTEQIEKKPMFKVCILSDIHEDLTNLTKALEKVENSSCMSTFVLGDLTNYGDVKTLQSVQDELDLSGIKYYVLPGDHDLAQSVSTDNFKQVFGNDYQVVSISGVEFIMIDNSANYTLIDDKQMFWIENNIKSADYVLLSQPLFVEGLNPPFNSIYMGSTRTAPTERSLVEKQQAVADQGKTLLKLIRDASNVKGIFAGEHHKSSELDDPVRKDLKHYVVGAVTGTVNDYPQSAIQTPRFSVVTIYEDKSVLVEDVLIE